MRIFREHSIPQHAHPLIRWIFEEMNRQRTGVLEVSERSGINKNTFRRWRDKSQPRIGDLEAVAGALGFELRLVMKRD